MFFFCFWSTEWSNVRTNDSIPVLPKEIVLEILKQLVYKDALPTYSEAVVPIGFQHFLRDTYLKYTDFLKENFKKTFEIEPYDVF